MNALQALQATAGQRTHEALYGAVFIWNGNEFPCTHGDITTNPPLITGGYSPQSEVWVTVRTESFGAGPYPTKDQPCFLRPVAGDGVLALKVATVQASVGDVIQKILCVSVDQGA
ncbi:MAG: hypothetical protein ABFD89_06845 [Bryobacteraceae bacterium]